MATDFNSDAYKVLTFQQWLELAGVSRSTGLRILDSGNGPRVIQLSERRFGIRLADHAEWCERVARNAPPPVARKARKAVRS
jgi:predicted DNA-binding transcriptional regulator AlpA